MFILCVLISTLCACAGSMQGLRVHNAGQPGKQEIGGGLYYMQYEVGGGEVYFNQLVTPTVWIATLGTIVVCGLLLTILCAFISVNRFLKMSGADMYLK